MMTQIDNAKTYTPANTWFTFSSITADARTLVRPYCQIDEPSTGASRFGFLSLTVDDEEALSPNDSLWTKIDAMLAQVWASYDDATLKEEERLYAEMQELERLADLNRFEELYGQIDEWE